jgi:hypothetical protein
MNNKIINNFFILFSSICLFNACKQGKEQAICQKWKTVSLKNSTMEREIEATRAYIDTLGDNDPEIRMTINIDSAKLILGAQLAQSIKEQKLAEENTLMEFLSNGVVYTTSIDGIDSAMYSIEDNFVKIDEAKLKGYGESMTFEILTLNNDTLKLRLIDYGDTSVVTMIPIK